MANESSQIGTLVIHHLQLSQSERVVWLMEELGLPYELRLHQRDPTTALAPKSIKDLHPAGTAPVLEDILPDGKRICITESGAIIDYILGLHGRHRLTIPPTQTQQFADYVYWLSFANGSLQPSMSRLMTANGVAKPLRALGGEAEKALENNFALKFTENKLATNIGMLDTQLKDHKFLVGDEVTVADIMTVFTLTTMRGFAFLDLTGYKNVLRYLGDIAAQPGYKRAMKRGDPDLEPMIKPKYETGFVFNGNPFFDVRT